MFVMRGPLATTVFALALTAGAAHAQAPAPAPNPAADAALAEGRRLYDLQEWDQAIAKFKEAYALREEAAALFNIAQSYRLKGDCAQAANFYKTFKRKFPAEKNMAKVEKFIVEMDVCAKNTTTSTTDPTKTDPTKTDPTKTDPTKTDPTKTDPTKTDPTKTEPTKASGSGGGGALRVAGYATMGAGGAGLIVGVVFGVKARSEARAAEALGDGDEWKPAIEDRGLRYQRVAVISLISGGVLVAGGVAMYLLSRESSSERSSVTIAPTSDGAQLVWGGSF